MFNWYNKPTERSSEEGGGITIEIGSAEIEELNETKEIEDLVDVAVTLFKRKLEEQEKQKEDE